MKLSNVGCTPSCEASRKVLMVDGDCGVPFSSLSLKIRSCSDPRTEIFFLFVFPPAGLMNAVSQIATSDLCRGLKLKPLSRVQHEQLNIFVLLFCPHVGVGGLLKVPSHRERSVASFGGSPAICTLIYYRPGRPSVFR